MVEFSVQDWRWHWRRTREWKSAARGPVLIASEKFSMIWTTPRKRTNHFAIPWSPTTRKSSAFRGRPRVWMQVRMEKMWSGMQLSFVTLGSTLVAPERAMS